MQSPGRAEEDTRGGFTHGGWSIRGADDEMLAPVYARVAESGGLQLLLRGRRHEEMLAYWNTQDGLFKDGLNNAPKYVASRTLREPLPWRNSTLLRGEPGDAVAELKRQASGPRRLSVASLRQRRGAPAEPERQHCRGDARRVGRHQRWQGVIDPPHTRAWRARGGVRGTFVVGRGAHPAGRLRKMTELTGHLHTGGTAAMLAGP